MGGGGCSHRAMPQSIGGQAEVNFARSLESFGTMKTFFTKSMIARFLWGLIAISVACSVHHTIRAMQRKTAGNGS